MSDGNGSPVSWNDRVIAQFREGRERVVDTFDRDQLLLLHTVGARSGRTRISPLGHLVIDGEIVIVGSAAGADKHPDWYHNLLAHPEVTIERWHDGALETLRVRAESAPGGERDRLWEQVTALAPMLVAYQKKTSRTIPVVVLHRL
jgi:deazaflavin-dependent oxidoreductase (nitroreductase family)